MVAKRVTISIAPMVWEQIEIGRDGGNRSQYIEELVRIGLAYVGGQVPRDLPKKEREKIEKYHIIKEEER